MLCKIEQELNIYPYPNESDECMKARLFYSIAGRWALACLWDNGQIVSIESVKDTVRDCLKAFLQMSPDVEQHFSEVPLQNLIEEIYQQYCKTGYFYHRKYHVSAPTFMQANAGGCCFLRGLSSGLSCKMSGLGPYHISCNTSETDCIRMEEMFHYPCFPVEKWWKRFQEKQSFHVVKTWRLFEFLQKNISTGTKWWKTQPDSDGTVSLMRTVRGTREYHLYRFLNGVMQISDPLPSWQTCHFKYCRIAAAIMQESGSSPRIYTEDVGGIKKIQLQYMLPQAEQNFFELYSWPSDFMQFRADPSDNAKFQLKMSRVMAGEVYPAFYKMASQSGYRFEEIKNGTWS